MECFTVLILKKLISLLQIEYGDMVVNFWDKLTPTMVKDMPNIKYRNENNAFYTLIMTGEYQ